MQYTAHYFTDNRNLQENRKDHSFRFSGTLFTFTTDNGVFSKDGVDFGTEVLLTAVTQNELHGDILDLGCGYGPVGVVLKTLYPQSNLISVDVNPRAVELTEINAVKNHVELNVLVSDGFANINQQFDYVITNPPIRAGKKVIYKMFQDAYAHLKEHGQLYAVIRKQQGAESAIKELTSIFENCEVVERKKGFWVLMCSKLTD